MNEKAPEVLTMYSDEWGNLNSVPMVGYRHVLYIREDISKSYEKRIKELKGENEKLKDKINHLEILT